jgi:hypothetical protein
MNRLKAMSAPRPLAIINGHALDGMARRFVPLVLKKSFFADD